MLSLAEYHSAKRSTFNAFYTSPTVIGAIHEGITRLGVPKNATILEPGCGIGNFMRGGEAGHRYIGIELEVNQKFPKGPAAAWRAVRLLESSGV